MEEENKDETQIEEVILTRKRFSKMVEEHIKEHPDSSYMEAVLFLCEERAIDPLDVSKLITQVIREKIEAEAMRANLVKGGGNQLPI